MRPPHECGGKQLLARLVELGLEPASMRPPHECGGKRGAGTARRTARRRFNEAPARMRGKTVVKLINSVGGNELQ